MAAKIETILQELHKAIVEAKDGGGDDAAVKKMSFSAAPKSPKERAQDAEATLQEIDAQIQLQATLNDTFGMYDTIKEAT